MLRRRKVRPTAEDSKKTKLHLATALATLASSAPPRGLAALRFVRVLFL